MVVYYYFDDEVHIVDNSLVEDIDEDIEIIKKEEMDNKMGSKEVIH